MHGAVKSMMNCRNCGSPIPEGQDPCPQCFTPVRKAGFLARLFGQMLRGQNQPVAINVEKTLIRRAEHIEVVDESGERQVFHSIDDLPPDIRSRIESLRSGAPDVPFRETFTFKDETGQERTYHSVEEMPAEVRKIYEQVHNQFKPRQ